MPRLVSPGAPVHEVPLNAAKKEVGDSVSTGTGSSGSKDEEERPKPAFELDWGPDFMYGEQLRSPFGPGVELPLHEDTHGRARQGPRSDRAPGAGDHRDAPGRYLAEVALRAHEDSFLEFSRYEDPAVALSGAYAACQEAYGRRAGYPDPYDAAYAGTWYPDRMSWDLDRPRSAAPRLDDLAAGAARRSADQWIYAAKRPHTPPPLLSNQSSKWRSLVLPVLSSKVTVGDIRKLFQEYTVKSVKVVQGRRTGFVNFGTHEDAACALLQAQRGELVLGGQRLHAAWAKRNADSTRVRLARRGGDDSD